MNTTQCQGASGSNHAVWESKQASASEKMNAWRKQKLLLENATCKMDDATHYDVLQEHHIKLEKATCTEIYIQERIANCLNLLRQSRRLGDGGLPVKWDIPQSHVLESPCCGIYESCKHDEMKDELLGLQQFEQQQLLNSTAKQPSNAIIQHMGEFNASEALPVSRAQPAQPTSQQAAVNTFRTAREELALRQLQNNNGGDLVNCIKYKSKRLGAGRGVHSSFVPPIAKDDKQKNALKLSDYVTAKPSRAAADSNEQFPSSPPTGSPTCSQLDQKMVEQIKSEIMHKYNAVDWDDIAGLKYAKSVIKEAIIFPLLRPELFTGLRRPARGILLFGPPGTGKTLIAKCIASQSGATFFSINPSSLTSKWVGEGEKLVKTLFAVAAQHQPAVIFIDEVDSLLSQRSDSEHESSRRLKNEFFIQLDGATTNKEERIVIIGATNRPQELDEAVRRRFVRRLYVPLPELEARQQIIQKLIQEVKNDLSAAQVQEIAELTEGYSGADIDSLCHDAALAPVRGISSSQMRVIPVNQLRDVTIGDFHKALQHVAPSVSPEDTEQYIAWNKIYGAKI